MEERARRAKQFAAAQQVDSVVRVAGVSGAAAHPDDVGLTEATEVIRDEILGPADQIGQLTDLPITVGELSQQAPAHGVACQTQKLWRICRLAHD
jgi:hypothetical protein